MLKELEIKKEYDIAVERQNCAIEAEDYGMAFALQNYLDALDFVLENLKSVEDKQF